jgi:signal transduction histidine kinase/ligand-binding sensor domain-containing protein
MRFCIFILFFFSLVISISGQDYRILHWGIENGLSQGINQKIIRDSEGFVWATSYEGVNRFDGKTFRNLYSFPQKRNSIKGTETTGLVEDSLHKIWIGSGAGLNRYDPVTDSVITFSFGQSTAGSLQYIVPIAATEEEIICFDITGAITGYHCKTFIRRLIAGNIRWYDDYTNVNNSWLDKKKNQLWIPVAKGFACIDIYTGKTVYYLSNLQINAILPDDAAGIFLLGTENGIIEWNRTSGQINIVQTLQSTPLGKVTCLAMDKMLNKWIGTEEHGLFIINADKTITRITKSNEQNSISGNKINTIYCDKTGIVWISVATNGIAQLIPGNRFIHYSETRDTKNSLTSNVVRCFIEDAAGSIWIATQGGGINIFHPSSRHFTSLTRNKLPGLPFDFIRFMVKDEKNRAWIGTEKGMCRIDMISLKTTSIDFTGINNQHFPDPYIEQIIAFTGNSWLIATKEHGLFQLDKESVTARQLTIPGDKHVFYTAFVNDLLFISIWDDDPKIFSVKEGSWKALNKSITGYTITYVVYDQPAKKYWIGTLKGLFEADENLNILHHYTRENGLSNHYIYAMTLDKQGLLWITTNRGLSQFNTRTRRFRVFTPADGLQGYEYNAKAAFQDSAGNLYFGGTNGFDIVRNAVRTWEPEPARFYIKDFLINNVVYSGKENIRDSGLVYLPYTGNNITIQTGIIDFTSSGNNKFRYKLEGTDTGWKTTDRDISINYSGLPPGNYTFIAAAADNNNEWNENNTVLHFIIAKPWWQTWWFRAGLVIFFAVTITVMIRYYYQRKLEKQKRIFEKQQAVEHERTRIATDMHDDMGAGLSRIKFLSETIGIKKQQQEPIEEDISKIREYSNDMIGKMGEIVWALNEKNDSLSDLLSYTRAYAVEYLSQNGINPVVTSPEQFPTSFVSGEFRRNIYLTVKEALHNIVKHARAKQVDIHIETDRYLFISISDDGIGFDEKNIRPFSNGLTNMKKRMERMDGNLEIKNGNGITVILKVPLP